MLVEGKVPWSINIRFPTASVRVWNNLSNRQVILRDGAKADLGQSHQRSARLVHQRKVR